MLTCSKSSISILESPAWPKTPGGAFCVSSPVGGPDRAGVSIDRNASRTRARPVPASVWPVRVPRFPSSGHLAPRPTLAARLSSVWRIAYLGRGPLARMAHRTPAPLPVTLATYTLTERDAPISICRVLRIARDHTMTKRLLQRETQTLGVIASPLERDSHGASATHGGQGRNARVQRHRAGSARCAKRTKPDPIASPLQAFRPYMHRTLPLGVCLANRKHSERPTHFTAPSREAPQPRHSKQHKKATKMKSTSYEIIHRAIMLMTHSAGCAMHMQQPFHFSGCGNDVFLNIMPHGEDEVRFALHTRTGSPREEAFAKKVEAILAQLTLPCD